MILDTDIIKYFELIGQIFFIIKLLMVLIKKRFKIGYCVQWNILIIFFNLY